MAARGDLGWAPGQLSAGDGAAPIAILDFLANAEAVVHRLGEHTGVRDWVLTRRLGDEWVVLAAHGTRRFRPGDALDRPEGVTDHLAAVARAWESDVVVDLTADHVRTVADGGRRDGARRDGVPVLAGVAAYPLWDADGLFGAVVALPASPVDEAALRDAEPIVRLTVELLTSLLGLDLDRSRLQRQLDAAQSAALSDALTSLGNRRAFDRALEREEARCARFGHVAAVVVLDLDGLKATNDTWGHEAGDDLIRRAAATVRDTLRSADQAFRIGGDEFALLLPEIDRQGVDGLCQRLTDALAGEGVSASIGSAVRAPTGNLHAVARDADHRMYERKRTRSAPR